MILDFCFLGFFVSSANKHFLHKIMRLQAFPMQINHMVFTKLHFRTFLFGVFG